jgi:prepilin-type N-terminal cleavage/methylation domain-containing protein
MRHPGFTLIELMIVVAVIALIASIAIPSLLRSRMAANEAAAIESCRVFAEAEEIYHRVDYAGNGILTYATSMNGTYGLLGANGSIGLVDSAAASAEGNPGTATAKSGYVYTILTGQGSSAQGGALSYVVKGNMTLGYAVSAVPAGWDTTGRISASTSTAGVVFQLDQGPISPHLPVFDPTTSWVPCQ